MLPSTPESVNSGRKAAMMIAAAKKIERETSAAALRMAWLFMPNSVSDDICSDSDIGVVCVRRRKIASTMMTVASTIRPKSIAPTDSRFADSPRSTRMITAKNSANGMVAPTISALRRSPKDPLQQHDQENADHHVVQHGVGGEFDQVAAVVDAFDAHAGRQDAGLVDGLNELVDALDGWRALLAAAHQDDALHDVVGLIEAGNAETWLLADGDGGDVLD